MHDHRRKLEWAGKHLDTLDHSIRVFLQSTPCHVTIKFNPKTRQNEARVTDLEPINPEWSMMVGDIVHAMRSSLDSVTYALAVKHSGQAAADAFTALQFPICDTFEGFHGTAKKQGQKRRITLLSVAAQTAIESLQPYNRVIPNRLHPLPVLRDLSNIDKHRHVIVTYPRGDDVTIKVFGPGVPVGATFGSGFGGTIEEGTLVGMLSIHPYPGAVGIPFKTDMEVDPTIALDIQFSAGKHRGYLVPYLRAAYMRINNEVFLLLEKLLA